MAEACVEEVAFDQGKDPDVETIKALPTPFEDWFDLQTFKNSGVMARGPSRCATLVPVVQPLRGRPCL